jgi:predicted GNAT family N-acyltransferase
MQPQPPFRIREASWSRDEAALRRVRARVFVVEQGVPEELEWDGRDAQAVHLIAETAGGLAIGTARLLPGGRLGRMAVLPDYRGQGVGSALLKQALVLAGQQGLGTLRLNAQIQVVSFYQRFGFETVGKRFEEAGIPHQAMRLTVQ